MKITVAPEVLALGFAAIAQGQEAPPARAFDVASVKPNTSGGFRKAIGPGSGGRFQALNNALRELVTYACGIDMTRA